MDGSFWGPKVEIKNMNSFRSVVRALKFEEIRQRDVLASGGSLVQETRGWSDATGVTVSQRTKEQAHDYRYFPEPDLPPLTMNESRLDEIRQTIGELPIARRDRYEREFALSHSEASLLAGDVDIAAYFDSTIGDSPTAHTAKVASNWILNDVLGLQKAQSLPSHVFPISPDQLRDLIALVETGKITGRAAKELLPQIGAGRIRNSGGGTTVVAFN